jgi:hypothetical protein
MNMADGKVITASNQRFSYQERQTFVKNRADSVTEPTKLSQRSPQ